MGAVAASPETARRTRDSLFARLRRLERREWLALMRALPLVLQIRLTLWTFTSTRVHDLLVKRARSGDGLPAGEVERLARSVARAARLVPYATCLTQAFALQTLLAARGEPSSAVIGFLRDPRGEVKGHAWLVWEGQVVIGARSSGEFTRLLTLEG